MTIKAKTLKQQYVQQEVHEKFGVIAISQDTENMFWYHVHDDEEVPEGGYDIALLLRNV